MSGPMFEPTEFRGTAEERAERALQQIEGAQELLSAAARNLCPIIGAAAQHQAIVKLYDRVKSYWYKLNAKIETSRGKWLLDGRPDALPPAPRLTSSSTEHKAGPAQWSTGSPR